jgi:hypothetical protein
MRPQTRRAALTATLRIAPAGAARLLRTLAAALLVAALLGAGLFAGGGLAGCAQFGVPELPPAYRDPHRLADPVLVAYQPDTVLGFGHTGVLIRSEAGGYDRFDQYASAELAYGERLRDGSAHFWEGLTARLPSIFGLTREAVLRRRGTEPSDLLEPGELLLPLPALDPGRVRAAAEARWADADGLERNTAARYVWLFNNCHHFVRDILRAGGEIPERYFPKHWVEEAIGHLPAR